MPLKVLALSNDEWKGSEMTNLQALQNLDLAAAGFNCNRDQHAALIHSIAQLKKFIEDNEKKPEEPVPSEV